MLVSTTFSVRLAENLWEAVNNNSIDEVKSLLDKGADPNHELYRKEEWISERGWPPLLLACITNNLEMVKVLVQRGSDIEKGDALQNLTPLHGACVMGSKELVEYLVKEAGCKVGKFSYPPLSHNYSLKLL